MIGSKALLETLKPNETEIKLGDHILDAASKQLGDMFQKDTTLRIFEVNRTPLVKAAQDAVGTKVNDKVRAYMVEHASTNGWKLTDLGGDKGDKMIFKMKSRGGPRGPRKSKVADAADASTETPAEDEK